MRKPDRVDDVVSEKPKEKSKKPEKPMKEALGSVDLKKRQNSENKDDRVRK